MSDSDEIPTVKVATPSGEAEAVPAALEDLEDSAALAKLPMDYQVADIRRRLREGSRRHARLKSADEELRAEIEKLRNMVAPRTTPTRALRVLMWLLAAVVAVAGWIAALDRFAKSADLDDLERRVWTNERKLSEMEGFLKAKLP